MKNLFSLLFSIILFLPLVSCDEEESPLLFSVEDITNTENVRINYFSPDPTCVPKSYTIYANYGESALTIKCDNANPIYFDKVGSTVSEYVCPQANWKAELVGSDMIVFTFNQIDESDNQEILGDGVLIYAQNKKGDISTYIQVLRFPQI